MSYLIELVKGIILAFGMIIGFVIMAVTIIKLAKRKDGKYKAEDLLPAFNEYLAKVKKDELFEQIKDVDAIIAELGKGIVPETVKNYFIKRDTEVQTSDENGAPSFKIVTKYIIINRKNNVKDANSND